MKNQRGVTLFEILIAISVLGCAMTLVQAVLQRRYQSSRDAILRASQTTWRLRLEQRLRIEIASAHVCAVDGGRIRFENASEGRVVWGPDDEGLLTRQVADAPDERLRWRIIDWQAQCDGKLVSIRAELLPADFEQGKPVQLALQEVLGGAR